MEDESRFQKDFQVPSSFWGEYYAVLRNSSNFLTDQKITVPSMEKNFFGAIQKILRSFPSPPHVKFHHHPCFFSEKKNWLCAAVFATSHFWLLEVVFLEVHPRKLTWIPKMAIFKRNHLLQTIILGIHVSFRGCIAFVPSTLDDLIDCFPILDASKISWCRSFGVTHQTKKTGRFLVYIYIPGSLNHQLF